MRSRNRGALGILILFRVVATTHALMLCLQPLFAGMFLNGQYGLLNAHGGTGGAIIAVAAVQVMAAVLLWWPARVAAWPVLLSVGVLVGSVTQVAVGYSRELSVHVPLGVALVATGVVVAVWSWRTQVVAS